MRTPAIRWQAPLPHTWLPGGRSLHDTLGDGFTLLRLTAGADARLLTEAASRRRA